MTHQPYPKMLYRDHGSYGVAIDEAQHQAMLAEGYVAFEDLAPENPDGLERLTDEQLRIKLLALAHAVIAARPRSELIFAIRFQTEAAELEKLKATADVQSIEPASSPAEEVIYGSARHGETVDIGGQSLNIGPIVRSAFVDSGMSMSEWNAVSSDTRDNLIQLTIDRLAEADAETALTELGEGGAEPLAVEAEAEPAIDTAPTSEADILRADLTALGVTFDKRWGVAKLQAALDAATKPEA